MYHGVNWLRKQKVVLLDVLYMCMRNFHPLVENGDVCCCLVIILLFEAVVVKYRLDVYVITRRRS